YVQSKKKAEATRRKCASVFRLPEIHSTDSLKQKKTMLSCFVKLTALCIFKGLCVVFISTGDLVTVRGFAGSSSETVITVICVHFQAKYFLNVHYFKKLLFHS
ncbi:MAG: hypothetical protein IJY32_05525, partial [Mogibacterium sp.]|nr:hypothetical protein [Mogibacterium sp.]